jgi:transcriptional regulator
MYVPEEFAVSDEALLRGLMREWPFATLVTAGFEVTHVPLLLDASGTKLRGHLAMGNTQLEALARGVDALAIFHGPHGYISPRNYSHHPSVPTWNYAVVHATGPTRLLDGDELSALIDQSVATFERAPLPLPADYRAGMLERIRGFELEIAQLQGKLKLSQNRAPDEQARVIAHLEGGSAAEQSLAELMRRLVYSSR